MKTYNKELKENQLVECPNCQKKHKVRNGIETFPDNFQCKTNHLQYVKCGKEAYLVGLNGMKLNFKNKEK